MEGCCHLTLVCLVVVVFSLSAHLPWVEPLCICILSDSNYSFESHFVPVCSLSCFHTSTQQWYQSQQRSLVQIFPSLSSTTVGISNPSSITKAFQGQCFTAVPTVIQPVCALLPGNIPCKPACTSPLSCVRAFLFVVVNKALISIIIWSQFLLALLLVDYLGLAVVIHTKYVDNHPPPKKRQSVIFLGKKALKAKGPLALVWSLFKSMWATTF